MPASGSTTSSSLVGGFQHDVLAAARSLPSPPAPPRRARGAGPRGYRLESAAAAPSVRARRQQPVVLDQHPQIVHHVALQFQADTRGVAGRGPVGLAGSTGSTVFRRSMGVEIRASAIEAGSRNVTSRMPALRICS